MRKALKIGLSLLAVLVVAVVIVVSFAIEEPLRRSIERDMNDRLTGYTARITKLHFHPFGGSLDLLDVVLLQNANPDPPVMRIPRLHASVQWKELFSWRVVADFRLERPILYVNRAHFEKEKKDPTPIGEHGWQSALEAIYPFKINRFQVVDADLTYADTGPFKPLRLTQVTFVADNIRNIHSPERTYPSPLKLRAVVFEAGRLVVDGHADFLAVPYAGMKANVTLEGMDLGYFEPITRRYNVNVRKGVLSTAGNIEYASNVKTVELKTITVANVDADYVHKAETAQQERQVARQAKATAKRSQDQPGLLLHVAELKMVKSRLAFVDTARGQDYRLFLSDANLTMNNLSNHHSEGTASAHLTGKFMGSGDTVVDVRFRPAKSGPDFDVDLKIEKADLTSLNNLLLAYGKFDVAAGDFSLYSQLTAKNGMMNGYVKPIFADVQVYDKEKDKDKPFGQRFREHVVGGLTKVLRNRARGELATTIDISRPLETTKTPTAQALVGLLRNAFVRAILPGFDRQVGTRVARK